MTDFTTFSYQSKNSYMKIKTNEEITMIFEVLD